MATIATWPLSWYAMRSRSPSHSAKTGEAVALTTERPEINSSEGLWM